MGNFSENFADVYARWNWKPIRNCPGRFILEGGASNFTIEELCVATVKSEKFVSAVVPDEVVVAAFATGGGLISYVKKDNQFLHTLNDAEGFARKLAQLQIVLW